MKKYVLPKLNYDYNALAPHISEEQLRLHHEKHHRAYVDNANKIIEQIEQSRKDKSDLDLKSALKFLSFNLGGHLLHSIFWQIMSPLKENEPKGEILEAIKDNFNSFERFKDEFSKTALSVEGSGWAVLAYEKESGRLILGQLEKHNLFLYPNSEIVMALDVWEHSYYLDYKNDKAKFIENFWNIVDFKEVEKNLEALL